MKIYQSLEARGRDTTSWKDGVLGQQTKQIGKLCRKQMDYMQMKRQNIQTYRNNISELISLAQHNLPDDLHDNKDLPAFYNILE